MSVNRNVNLTDARRNKQDEFYTPLEAIESQLRHFRDQFRGKTVLCNCDDPYESNFFKYFAMNFNSLGLKKLISTCYSGSPVAFTQLSLFDGDEFPVKDRKKPYRVEITEVRDWNGDGRTDLLDVEHVIRNGHNSLSILEGDGDFRSPECMKLLDEADIVVTNPPFSLFREYVDTLIEHGKRFLIIGSNNAISYRNVFERMKEGRMWLGHNCKNHVYFRVPQSYEGKYGVRVNDDGSKEKEIFIVWYTNMDFKERHEDLILFRNYNPKDYPMFDNYDAINVDKTCDIPCDYDGVMGVPITYMLKHNPDQFEIIGHTRTWDDSPETESLRTDPDLRDRGFVNGKEKYARILIRRRKGSGE